MIYTKEKRIPFDEIGHGEIEKRILTYDDLKSVSKQTKLPLTTYDLLAHILKNLEVDIALKTLGNVYAARAITVGTSPTLIIPINKFPRGYLIQNPSLSTPTTATGTLYSGTFAVDTNTSPLSVGNYLNLQLFMNITDSTGTALTINAQAQDPVSSNWVTTQSDIFSASEATGTYYASLGSLGIATDFRLNMVPTGSYTLSIGYVLKEGVPGSGAGVNQVIYIGNSSVNSNSLTLFEGQERIIFLKENTELWAIANTSLTIKIFELQ